MCTESWPYNSAINNSPIDDKGLCGIHPDCEDLP